MPHDVDPAHEVLPECACDLCDAARADIIARADDATAEILAEVEAWFSATVGAAFPWERDCTENLSGCAL